MYLNVVPSHDCAMTAIRVPAPVMKALDLDYGDWLVFNTECGLFSVMVTKTLYADVLEHGPKKTFVNSESPILSSTKTDVYIEPHELTVGADPEFFILNRANNRLVMANTILPFEGQVGSDADLGELRPDYALGPEQLTENIRKLIIKLNTSLPYWTFPYAASYYNYRCSGFHVHLGMPRELMTFAADDTDKFLKNLISLLDYFVYLPTAAWDKDNRRRLSWDYGSPGDYRLNMRTLEYRTPGGFLLRTPAYTKHLLVSTFGVVEKILHESEKISGGWRDMNEITNHSYFNNKYGIPPKKEVNRILCTKNKQELIKESEASLKTLKHLLGDDSEYILSSMNTPEKPLLEEWAKHEAQHQIGFHQA